MNDKPISDVLAEAAEIAERTKDDPPGQRHRNRAARRDPAQVYSIRIPVAHLEDIRRLAAERGVQPTAMLRSWILDRLETELSPSGAERPAAGRSTYGRSRTAVVVDAGSLAVSIEKWQGIVTRDALGATTYFARRPVDLPESAC